MLSLDQVRLLENRVEKAVGKISSLTAENENLRAQLGTLQQRVRELEGFVNGFKDDQGKIEAGILNALEQLGALESAITSEPVQEQPAPSIEEAIEPEPDPAPYNDSVSEEPEPDSNDIEDSVQDDGQIYLF